MHVEDRCSLPRLLAGKEAQQGLGACPGCQAGWCVPYRGWKTDLSRCRRQFIITKNCPRVEISCYHYPLWLGSQQPAVASPILKMIWMHAHPMHAAPRPAQDGAGSGSEQGLGGNFLLWGTTSGCTWWHNYRVPQYCCFVSCADRTVRRLHRPAFAPEGRTLECLLLNSHCQASLQICSFARPLTHASYNNDNIIVTIIIILMQNTIKQSVLSSASFLKVAYCPVDLTSFCRCTHE